MCCTHRHRVNLDVIFRPKPCLQSEVLPLPLKTVKIYINDKRGGLQLLSNIHWNKQVTAWGDYLGVSARVCWLLKWSYYLHHLTYTGRKRETHSHVFVGLEYFLKILISFQSFKIGRFYIKNVDLWLFFTHIKNSDDLGSVSVWQWLAATCNRGGCL